MEDFELTPEALEAQVEQVSQVDEFNEGMNFDKFVVLSKKDLSNFCRIVDPLTKQAIDDYGKCVHFKCVDSSTVELGYVNTPYVVYQTCENKSGKSVMDFSISVGVLKRLVTQAFSSVIFVEKEGDINIALCEDLLYLETKPFLASQYDIQKKETTSSIDKELASFVFKKVSSSLALTERQAEKTVVIHGDKAIFNTGVFVASVKSPFNESNDCVLYYQVVSILSVLSELSKVDIKYAIQDETLVLSTDNVYVETQIGGASKVESFMSPTTEMLLSFDATVSVINSNLLRIVSVVKSLDYLSDIVTVSFEDKNVVLTISNASNTRNSEYKFAIIGGSSNELGSMKMTTDVLKLFLTIIGDDCTYTLTQSGLGISSEGCKFLIRKS